MLNFIFDSPFLFREDAYREYCYSVDVYGSYQPASFIYLSFESFRDLCKSRHINLIPFPKPYRKIKLEIPYKVDRFKTPENIEIHGYIIRLNDLDESKLENIKKMLQRGINIVLLDPKGLLNTWYSQYTKQKEELENKINKYKSLLNLLEFDNQLSNKLKQQNKTIQWVEIPTNNNGRLFYSIDIFFSDKYFLKGYGKSDINDTKLLEFVDIISTFKYPLISISYINPLKWGIIDETIIVYIELINFGPTMYNTKLDLILDNNFEPIGSLVKYYDSIPTHKPNQFGLQIIPRFIGIFNNVLNYSISSNNTEMIKIFPESFEIDIKPTYRNTVVQGQIMDDANFTKLIFTSKTIPFVDEINILPKLYTIDLKACANKIRIVTEKIVNKILINKNIKINNNITFYDKISLIKKHHIVSQKCIGYLHTIRIVGNIGSHPGNTVIKSDDIQIISYSLASVIEELLEINVF